MEEWKKEEQPEDVDKKIKEDEEMEEKEKDK